MPSFSWPLVGVTVYQEDLTFLLKWLLSPEGNYIEESRSVNPLAVNTYMNLGGRGKGTNLGQGFWVDKALITVEGIQKTERLESWSSLIEGE